MAHLTHLARPWLLSLRQPMRASAKSTITSPHFGLGHSRSISATTAARASGSALGRKAKPRGDPRAYARANARAKRDQMRLEQNENMANYLLPHTIVPPPLSRFPRSPIEFGKLVYAIGTNRMWSLLARLTFWVTSMRTSEGVGWPKFRSRKGTAIPAAKVLHRQMSEAVAAGDKETLRRICSHGLFEQLAGAIDSRPRGTRTEWELVRYTNPFRYPRIADFRVSYRPIGTSNQLAALTQAVVSISSVQRLARYDAHGNTVPGGDRERQMVEHVVLHASFDDTFEPGPWKLWGTLPEMSYETMKINEDLLADKMNRTDGRSS
ncbi:hypothetical protein F4808DRAFT_372898 [Astrocystis sublimbata]|nr:hypothetical protein F4808DRAFT_372898 [Astrocystis sublimbata]